ncbi:hypothetical protein EDB85DRAFT_1924198 [Lactarius pseudohatsudake]|nr:hypothetical protein EDB85DRAFT_1924198 [Lactarius pseudohatsudake]
MSIKSGQRYKITNEQHKLVVDLSAADHKSVLGHTFHGGENQLWITEKHVNGQWTIRSVEHQKYLGVETSTSNNGTHLVGLDQPQFWDIEVLADSKDSTSAKPSVKLCQWVRGTCFVADYHIGGGAGRNLQLWSSLKGKNQVWVLEEYSSWFSHCGTSIKSGQRYKIVNEQNKLVVDLSRADNKSIIGCDFNGGENQQWVIEKQVNGQWTIQSVATGGYQKYLCVERTPDNGTYLVGLDQPQSWDIEIQPDPTRPSVKLCQWVRGTCFVADYPKDAGAGTNLQLWTACGGKNQVWVLEECESHFDS